MKYRPELDGVRAVCILFTVANHMPGAPPFINGSVGVDIFFALSGFLITTLLIAEKNETGSVKLNSFYVRRIFRIMPLYFLTIFLYILAACANSMLLHRSDELMDVLKAFPLLLTFNGEYRLDNFGFGHAWTLGIEEKFYLQW